MTTDAAIKVLLDYVEMTNEASHDPEVAEAVATLKGLAGVYLRKGYTITINRDIVAEGPETYFFTAPEKAFPGAFDHTLDPAKGWGPSPLLPQFREASAREAEGGE